MARPLAKIYANAVKKNQKVFYGVWEPGFPVKLGDYGVMTENIFTQLGNISELEGLKDFKLNYRKDDTKDEKFFTSQQGVQFELKPQAAGTVNGIKANASIEIKFSKENCIFFNGAECVFEIIENKYELGQKLLEIHKQSSNKWRREFVVVTDRVITKRALILISTSADFSITLEADASVPVIDLGKASLGLKVARQNSSGYKVITEEGIVPLIGLSKIQSTFLFFGKDFKPMSANYTKAMSDAIIDNETIKTEFSEDEMQFMQYTDDGEE